MSVNGRDELGLRFRRPSRDHDNDANLHVSPTSPISPPNDGAASGHQPFDRSLTSSPVEDSGSSAAVDWTDARTQRTEASDIPRSTSPTMAPHGPVAYSGLKLNTAQPARAGVGSPMSLLSPQAGPSTGPSTGIGRSLTAPVNPVTRDRGYSLRRVLFTRGMNASEGREIEPGDPVPPSSQTQPEDAVNQNAGPTERRRSVLSAGPNSLPRYEALNPSDSKEKKGLGTVALANYDAWVREGRSKSLISKINTRYKTLKKRILRAKEIPPSKDGRQLDLDFGHKGALIDERTNKAYVGNGIRSSRYNAWNFLPKQIVFQFGKVANFYFLIISILQMIPGLSTTGNYTTIIPLLIFNFISMGKEGYDDLRRHKLDKAENNKVTKVLHADNSGYGVNYDNGEATVPHSWEEKRWHNVKVGDVVKLERDEAVPADIVLLHSDGLNGIAYIETMALDGETNLKAKQAPAHLAKKCADLDGLIHCKAHMVLEDPNTDLYNFDGTVTVDGETLPLTSSEVVYRGSIVRNTSQAIGIVINTGEECKIRMNANKNPRLKSPHLQISINRLVVIVVLYVICLAAFMTIAYQVWRSQAESKAWYLDKARVGILPIMTSFVIMFNTMIPLSLYVSMEIIKLGQLFLMNDIKMYDPVSDTPMEAHTSTINEELGQINYIFSDKTGTLTDNIMQFRKLSVAGTAWLHDFDLQKESASATQAKDNFPEKAKGKQVPRKTKRVEQPQTPTTPSINETTGESISRRGSLWRSTARPAKGQSEPTTGDLLQYLQRKPHGVFARKARFFMLSLALCHTCLPEPQKDGSIDYQAASPDELALVRAAQELGYMVIDRAAQTITLRTHPNGPDSPEVVETYEVLDVIEFSSKRKRMSIIVRFPDGRRCILCKGADSIIMKRLKHAPLALRKVAEVERRSSVRKSMEVDSALRRMSETGSPRASMERKSMSLRRKRDEGVARSISLHGNKSPVQAQVQSWLRQRERDVDLASADSATAYVSPRTSQDPHRSPVLTEHATHAAEHHDDVVDETIAVDESAVFERCFQHVDDFATEGLRTLLYGYRFLDEQEYLGWKKIYHDASTSLVNRQELIEQAGEMIEQDFDLAGATAIEDKLQKGVPETIDKLRRASIKIWMLTGDKRETAINIGHSCRLIKDYSSVITLDHEVGNVEQVMATSLLELQQDDVPHSVLVVDGQTLSDIESNAALALLFFDLAVLADNVIICRSSPSQKAWAVDKVRTKVRGAITLAIGDGANDVGMIQAANVGIGISSSQEGSQAARVSDYSIAQFRFLQRLLLVHGRWNYERTVVYCLGTFWKEAMFYTVQAYFQHSSGYTGTSLFESASLSMFNTLFTSLPVIAIGIFSQSMHASTLEAVPELYHTVNVFKIKTYLCWMALAASEAAIIYGCSCGLYGLGERLNIQLFAMGDLAFTSCILVIATKLLVLEVHNKTYMPLICWFLSVGGWMLWNMLLSVIYPESSSTTYDVSGGFLTGFGREPSWWLVVLLAVSACIGLELVVKSIQKTFWPTDVDIFQELEKDPVIGQRFRDAAEGVEEEVADEHSVTEEDVQQLLDDRDDEMMSLTGQPTTRRPSVQQTAGRRLRHSLDIIVPSRAQPKVTPAGRRASGYELAPIPPTAHPEDGE
ncbi:MAG: hypothetical protein M1818_001710 [Claussenomyces sp. TS43310]|nr:MAG: hypothetical protein M1818_001710 [Claussenomyces sp. TS43310]